jgi:hypothetical protein
MTLDLEGRFDGVLHKKLVVCQSVEAWVNRRSSDRPIHRRRRALIHFRALHNFPSQLCGFDHALSGGRTQLCNLYRLFNGAGPLSLGAATIRNEEELDDEVHGRERGSGGSVCCRCSFDSRLKALRSLQTCGHSQDLHTSTLPPVPVPSRR